MANITNRSIITLFSSPTCAMSHCARFVLHEKGVDAAIEYYDPAMPHADFLEINPSGTSPTLVERDLIINDSHIIMEYLDERFPCPPLQPVDPVHRANSRMLIKRIDQEWHQLLNDVLFSGEKKAAKSRKALRESILSAEPVFAAKPYFMSDEISMIDCVIAPILWRLPSIGIDISNEAINSYANRMFNRVAFKRSLSDAEKEMVNI